MKIQRKGIKLENSLMKSRRLENFGLLKSIAIPV